MHWWAWGPEALAEAKRTGKPILLSVGYAACHWCHVMAHESFEDEATAARDERAVRQHQGRPRGAARHRRDLHGGAARARRAGRLAADHVPRPPTPSRSGAAPISPRSARYGRPAFVDVLKEVARIYRDEPDKVRQNADALKDRLAAEASSRRPRRDPPATRRSPISRRACVQRVDPTHGGISGAPKFPQVAVLRLPLARAASATALRQSARGGRRSPSPTSPRRHLRSSRRRLRALLRR